MTLSSKRQHSAISKNERHWATLAKKEGVSNLAQARRFAKEHKPTLAKNYRQEASWDFFWQHRRERIANREAKLARRK